MASGKEEDVIIAFEFFLVGFFVCLWAWKRADKIHDSDTSDFFSDATMACFFWSLMLILPAALEFIYP
jgi:hypothetical protein